MNAEDVKEGDGRESVKLTFDRIGAVNSVVMDAIVKLSRRCWWWDWWFRWWW